MLVKTDKGIGPVAVYSDIDPTNPSKDGKPQLWFHPENHTASSREHSSAVRLITVYQPQGEITIVGGRKVRINVGTSLAGSRTGAN